MAKISCVPPYWGEPTGGNKTGGPVSTGPSVQCLGGLIYGLANPLLIEIGGEYALK